MSETVFVVLGECGDYSEREVWVSGVFRELEEAQENIIERLSRRREYEKWKEAKNARRREYRDLCNSQSRPLVIMPPFNDEEIGPEGPPPKIPYEVAERAQIFEVKIGQWREWKNKFEVNDD